MKIRHSILTGLVCVLLAARTFAATDVVAGWYAGLHDAQQDSHQSDGGRARADVMLRTALDTAKNGVAARESAGQPAEPVPTGANVDVAGAQAAYSIMAVLYPQSLPALDARLAQSLSGVDDSAAAITAGREWGKHVALVVLADQSDAVFLNAHSFAEAKASGSSSALPDAQAELPPVNPGRYHFSVLAGAPGIKGHVNGTGAAARFDDPAGIAVDVAGNAYVSERNLGTIRKITPDGVVTTMAGAAGQSGSQDGRGDAARFSHPWGVAVDSTGNVYVADSGNHTIRKIEADGTVITLAGAPGISGHTDGSKETARFLSPTYVAVDNAGNVFVTESPGTTAGRIRKIAANGDVSTVNVTFLDISLWWLSDYRGGWPTQIACNRNGDLYVVYTDDAFMGDALKLTPNGTGEYQAVTMRPSAWVSGFPTGLTVDATDNLYVLYYLAVLCRFSPDASVTTHFIASDMGNGGLNGLAMDPSAKLLALSVGTDGTKGATIEAGVFDPTATDIVILDQPYSGHAYRGGDTRFHVWAMGSGPLTYQWYFGSAPIPGATGTELSLRNVSDDSAGAYHVMISDGVGSVASSTATLSVIDPPPPPPVPPSPTPPQAPSDKASNSSGSGSFDAGIALAMLGLLAAAAPRDRGTLAIAAPSRRGKMESS